MKIKPLSLLWATAGGFLPLSLEAQYDADLLGYWQFENDLLEDSGAGVHDGTAVGDVGFAAGPAAAFGQSVSFPAADALAVPPIESGGVTVNGTRFGEPGYVNTFDGNVSGALSISFWASGGLERWSPFIAKRGETGEGYQVRRVNTSSNATFTLRDTDGVDDPQGSIDILVGQPVWTHYAATWDGATGVRKLYINGVLDFAVTQADDFAAAGPGNAINYWLTFGMRHNDADVATFQNFFVGEMDDVAIWNRELSSVEAFQLSMAPLDEILLKVDADGDGLFASQEVSFGTLDTNVDSDNDGVNDFDEFVKGGDGGTNDDFDMDGLTNLQETSGSANPWTSGVSGATPGEATDWCVADSDGDGIDDGEEVVAGVDGFVTDPNNNDTDGDGFSDGAEIAEGSDPTDATSLPPITSGLVGYWAFENDLVETSGEHVAGTHDGATTDGFPAEFGTGPTVLDDAVLNDFGSSLNTVAEDTSYGVYVLGSNALETGYVNTYDEGIGNEFTVSLWAKGWPVANWDPFISKRGESSEGFQIRRRGNTQNATFTLRQTGGTDDPNVANNAGANQPLWRHYLGTWNGVTGERKLYVDGVLSFTITNDFESGDGVSAATDYWMVFGGRHDDADPTIFSNLSFAGEIDDVAFWHRALKPTEAAQLSTAPLSFVLSQTDADADGLFATQEAEFGTSDSLADTDADGVSDLDEYLKNESGIVTNGTVDDDPDMDGLLNSQETSGSANPWVVGVLGTLPGTETTDWCVADSDLDGINDGDEISAVNGFVTDPNNPDTDGDSFSDGDELFVGTDPTDAASTPSINDTLPIIDDFEDNMIAVGTFSTITGTVSQNATGSETGGTVEETGGCVVLGTRGYLYTTAQFDPEVVGGLEITGEMTGQAADDIVSIITRGTPIPDSAYGEAMSGIQFLLNSRNNQIDIVARNGDHTIANSTGPVPFTFAVDVFYTFQVIDDGVGGLSLTVTDRDNPATTATVFAELAADTSDVNHVIFYNREGANRMASLHEVSIVADPTPVDPGSGVDEIMVVDCSFDEVAEEFSITWVSQTTETYAINASTDLIDFNIPVAAGIVGQTGTTTLPIDTTVFTGEKVFFQISEE